MPLIGVLMTLAADDPESAARRAAFEQELQELGWIVGRNVQTEYRWVAGEADRYRRYAAELVALAPDVILSSGASATAPLQQATRTVPIVFAGAVDPVGRGLVASLARPGGNTTGFMSNEFSLAGKWLELLKQIAPGVTRAAVLRDPTLGSGTSEFAVLQAVAPSLRVELNPVDVRDAGEIERTIAAFTRGSDGGMIVTASLQAQIHRTLIIALAAQHRLPAVYPYRFYVGGGGLSSYGPSTTDLFRRAAGYVDRIRAAIDSAAR
jgi:putative ABC transport system substrate-binding protein